MASFVTSAVGRARSYAGAIAWEPLVKTTRHSILSLLSQIKFGRLTIIERDGTQTVCGAAKGQGNIPETSLRVVRDAFWLRVAFFADMVRCVAHNFV